MEQIFSFISNNHESIEGLIAVVVALAFMGRQRAKSLVLKFIGGASEDFLLNIEEHAPAYAKYIYAKIPKRARIFLSIKLIERLIIKFAKEIKVNLDKK